MIFGLMLLSLLETILVTYLVEKASASLEKQKVTDDCKEKQDKNIFNCNAGKTTDIQNNRGGFHRIMAYIAVDLCLEPMNKYQF